MANVTGYGNHNSTEDSFCIPVLLGTQQKTVFSAVNIPLSITAFVGNVLIIAALQKPSFLHPPSKLLLGSLAATDLCVGLISHPLRVIYLMSADHPKRCYYTEIASYSTGLFFCSVSLLTMTAISVDRLLALMLGLRYKQVVTLGRMWLVVILLWVSVIAISLTMYTTSCTGPFIEYTVCAIISLCLLTSTICFTKIYYTLRRHQARLNHQGQPNELGTPLNIARYKRTMSNALWVQITLVACYLPFGISAAIFTITEQSTLASDSVWEAAIVVVMLNSSLNPFIFCWKIKEIRQAVKDTIRRFCCYFS